MSRFILIALGVLVWIGIACSQASHNVTISVPQIIHADVLPTSLTITIDGSGAAAGDASFTKIDETTVFYWATNYNAGKVTVATDQGSPHYTLHIEAFNTTSTSPTSLGLPTGAFIITTTAQELITSISKSMGTAQIRYTGVAQATDIGGFSDNHNLTFTITTTN